MLMTLQSYMLESELFFCRCKNRSSNPFCKCGYTFLASFVILTYNEVEHVQRGFPMQIVMIR